MWSFRSSFKREKQFCKFCKDLNKVMQDNYIKNKYDDFEMLRYC